MRLRSERVKILAYVVPGLMPGLLSPVLRESMPDEGQHGWPEDLPDLTMVSGQVSVFGPAEREK